MASPFDDVSSLLYGAGSDLPQGQGGFGGFMSGLGNSLMALPQAYAQGYGQMLGLAPQGGAPAGPVQGWTMPKPAPLQQPALAPPPQPAMAPLGPSQPAPGFRFGAFR